MQLALDSQKLGGNRLIDAGPHKPKMLFAGQNNTQIAAPQRATNQASESQTSTSSRVMVGVYLTILGRAAKCGRDGTDAVT
jgi:hypothetical protein